MIVFRYLAKEVLLTTCAVTGFLLFIFLSNSFMRFMMQIANGKLAVSLLLHFLLLQIPFLLGYLLPIGLFFGILLAYGRLYADNEMTVLRACGFSEERLLGNTMLFSVFVAAIVGLLVMQIGPSMIREELQEMAMQAEQLLLQTIIPGRFQELKNGTEVVYVSGISRDRQDLNGVFVAQLQKPLSTDQPAKNVPLAQWVITTAQRAYQKNDPASGRHLIIAENGYRYDGEPGKRDYDIVKFAQLLMTLPQDMPASEFAVKELSALELWRNKNANLEYEAEWQWRISMPFSALMMVLLAIPLSRVKPRQGKFAKILPAALLYIIYANMLFVGRGWVENGSIPAWIGMWCIHGPILIIALLLWIKPERWRQIKLRL